jgi:hypothetical protein
MNKRAIAAASLIAALSLSSLAVGASAQEPADNADPSATSKTATGVVSLVNDTYYLTPDEGESIELSYGPSWLWGAASPLQLLVDLGEEVTLVGQIRDGAPNDNASETAQAQAADRMAVMHVRAVVGMELREKGRPPWAGGPKNEDLGEVHPGFEGWSKGQAEKAADKVAKAEEKAANAEAKAAEKAEKAAERAAAKAEKTAERAAAKAEKAAERAARAEEKGNRP